MRLLSALPWITVCACVVGVLVAAGSPRLAWRALSVATRAALALSLAAVVATLAFGPPDAGVPGASAAPLVATLITFLGWVIGDYSRRNLEGEPGQVRYVVAFLVTLASVCGVVASTHLGLLIAAWTASSAGLHHLLTFYRRRPAAVIVARKKFIVSRLAEICLVAAAALLQRQFGTLDLGVMAQQARAAPALEPAAVVAVVLIATAVVLKSAQLPLHGWLIQVMEAPTPVSALMHAGIVNLGGYLLIRLSPLISVVPLAQGILVVVGSLTAVLASLVMLTRVTIKVRLAWSTCSQMGFMLTECGLGLYDVALLHLLAHALYKAHAFLCAGETVRASLSREMIAPPEGSATAPLKWAPLVAFPVACALVSVSATAWHEVLHLPKVPWIGTALLSAGLATLLWTPRAPGWSYLRGLTGVVAATQLYLLWHSFIGARLGLGATSASPVLAGWVLLSFTGLYLAQWRLWTAEAGSVPSRLFDWAYAGFYLDERVTRLVFKVWPASWPGGWTAEDAADDFANAVNVR